MEQIGMRKIIMGAVAIGATTTAPAAYALNFTFTFIGLWGNVTTGELIGLAESGESAPTGVIITSSPLGVSTPYNIFSLPLAHESGGFSVHSGQIVNPYTFQISNRYQSYAGAVLRFDPGGWLWATQLFLTRTQDRRDTGGNLAGTYSRSSVKGTIAAAGIAPVFRNTATGSTPSSSPTSAPEPASIALLGAGLAGVAAFRRHRARG